MLKLTMGNKEYNLYFANMPTMAEEVLPKVAKMQSAINFVANGNDDFYESAKMLNDLAKLSMELCLIALQKNYRKDFGYNYTTKEGKEEQLFKVGDLLDDCQLTSMELFTKLVDLMEENRFLFGILKAEQEKVEKEEKKTRKTKLETQEKATPSLETLPMNPPEN